MFVVVVKFGNPVILDSIVPPPEGLSDIFYDTWPSRWAVPFMVPLVVAGLIAMRWERLKFRWALVLPAIWLVWQYVASSWTINVGLTNVTLRQFTIAVVLFYLAYVACERDCEWPIWAGLGLAICYSMRRALQQHFGELAATQQMFYSDPGASGLNPAILHDPEFIKRMAKMRVFGTFFYPNALASGLLLLIPGTLAFVWNLTPKLKVRIRIAFVVILGGAALGCLYWSGSKAGWLVALAIGTVALLHSPAPARWKAGIISFLLIAGLAGFALKYASFFGQERNSVGARVTYWKAACRIFAEHPLKGTGPGTFGILFNQIKPVGAEPSRLCHDDYLEQATDSGFFGFLSYTVSLIVAIWLLYRYSAGSSGVDWTRFSIWLGVLGLCLHMLVEFPLYIPALAWPLFFVLGSQFRGVFNDKASNNSAVVG